MKTIFVMFAITVAAFGQRDKVPDVTRVYAWGEAPLVKIDQKSFIVGLREGMPGTFPVKGTEPCGTYFIMAPAIDSHGPILAYVLEPKTDGHPAHTVGVTERDQWIVTIDEKQSPPVMRMKQDDSGIDGVTVLLKINSKDYAANKKCLPPIASKL